MSRFTLIRMLTVLLAALFIGGCGLTPKKDDAISDYEIQSAEKALAAFRSDERLAPYFEQADLIAIYHRNIRVGVGFGGAYGYGLAYQGDTVIGRTRLYQFSAGANVGGEVYRQILFFKNKDAFDRLFSGAMEFAGQANIALGPVGSSKTPSFNHEVALFTQLQGGLLLEASVGAHHYRFTPLSGHE